jgi:hypothetical protein
MLTASTNGLALDGGLDGPETVGVAQLDSACWRAALTVDNTSPGNKKGPLL